MRKPWAAPFPQLTSVATFDTINNKVPTIGVNTLAEWDLQKVDTVLKNFEKPADSLIAVLQELQAVFGYLPEPVLLRVCEKTGIPAATLSGVATFYAQFRMAPPGRHQVLVCMGTACHVNGAGSVAEAVEDALGVPEGETTADGAFSWEKVACLGCCSLSPVMMVDGRAYGKLTAGGVGRIFADIRENDAGGDA